MTLFNIFEERGLEHIEPAELDRLLEAAHSIIHGRVQLRIIDALSTDDRDHFFALLSCRGNDAKLDAFLQEKIPALDSMITTVVAECKEELVEKLKILNTL